MMIDDKELIRCALMGSREAQRKCTDEEIILPCPLCGGKASVQKDISGKERYHVVCSNVKNACNLVSGLPIWRGSAEEAIAEWNTRPAPPVGRCGECKAKEKAVINDKGFLICPSSGMEITDNDFCSYFEPKEV